MRDAVKSVLDATAGQMQTRGIDAPLRFAAALADGEQVWAFRWASDYAPPTLYPKVHVTVIEAIAWSDTLGMLERGEIHLGQNLLRAVSSGDARFAVHPLEVVDMLAAAREPFAGSRQAGPDIGRLAPQPLLVLDTSFVSRRTFDATCRLAGFEPNIVFESRTPHTLLAMAEHGHGIAVVPSAVQVNRYALNVVGVTYGGEPLRERLAVFRDARRTLPPYAAAFCNMLAEYTRDVLPFSRPTARRRRTLVKPG